MIWNNIELFNVARIEESDSGLRLYRYPKSAQQAFGVGGPDYAPAVGRMTTGCEMRFVADGADVTLTSVESGDGTVEIWRGDFLCKVERLAAGVATKIELRRDYRLDGCNLEVYRGRFSPDVWRVIFDHEIAVAITAFEPIGEVRPPRACEIPNKKMIAYGSSITHSVGARIYTNSYIYGTARRLGVDVLCKGMAGSCLIQREVADYIAIEEWDTAILELGINMVDNTPVEVFETRVRYMLEKLLPLGRPVVLISNYTSHHCCPGAAYREVEESYVTTLEALYHEYATDRLFYIRGRDIVEENYDWLLSDIIHPSPFGHFEMGKRIADKIIEFGII